MTEMIESQEFTCPRCGSHEFGTSGIHANDWPGDAEGMCHGYLGERICRFIWRRKDDALYFKGSGSFYPRTVMGTSR